jgi:hypothetical protein
VYAGQYLTLADMNTPQLWQRNERESIPCNHRNHLPQTLYC